jgi:hypothetical protein
MIRFHTISCILAALAASAHARPQAAAQSPSVVVIERDGDRIELRLQGTGHPSVTVNGKAVPAREWHNKDGKQSATAGDYHFTVTPPAGGQTPLVYSWGSAPDGTKAWPFLRPGALWQSAQSADEASAPHAYIGVQVGSVPPALAEQLALDADQCVLILSAIAGGPAESAGIKANDILMAIDGSDGVTDESLTKAVAGKQPGDKMTLTVLRKGKRQQIEVRVGKQATAAFPQWLDRTKTNDVWRNYLQKTPLTWTAPLAGYPNLLQRADREGEEKEHAETTIESLQRELDQIRKLCERLEKQLGRNDKSGGR